MLSWDFMMQEEKNFVKLGPRRHGVNSKKIISGLCLIFAMCVGHRTPAELAKNAVQIQGVDLLSGEQINVSLLPKNTSSTKGYILVFMSAVCPCSNSHVTEVKKLAQDFKHFQFIGVHSNLNEAKDLTVNYFRSVQMPFPVLADSEARLADEYKAYKTPHAFVLGLKGEILYQGGVTSSALADKADQHFLREALQDLEEGKSVRTPRGRTLGCVISRSKEE